MKIFALTLICATSLLATLALAPLAMAADDAKLNPCPSLLSSKTDDAHAVYNRFLKMHLQTKQLSLDDLNKLIEAAEKGEVLNPYERLSITSALHGAKAALAKMIHAGHLQAPRLAHELRELLREAAAFEERKTEAVTKTRLLPILALDQTWTDERNMTFVTAPDGRVFMYPTEVKPGESARGYDVLNREGRPLMRPGQQYSHAHFTRNGDEVWVGTSETHERLAQIKNVTQKKTYDLPSVFGYEVELVTFHTAGDGEIFAIFNLRSVNLTSNDQKIAIVSLENPEIVFESEKIRSQFSIHQFVRQPDGRLSVVCELADVDTGFSMYKWILDKDQKFELMRGNTDHIVPFSTPKNARWFLHEVRSTGRDDAVWNIHSQTWQDLPNINKDMKLLEVVIFKGGATYAAYFQPLPQGRAEITLINLHDVTRQEKIILENFPFHGRFYFIAYENLKHERQAVFWDEKWMATSPLESGTHWMGIIENPGATLTVKYARSGTTERLLIKNNSSGDSNTYSTYHLESAVPQSDVGGHP